MLKLLGKVCKSLLLIGVFLYLSLNTVDLHEKYLVYVKGQSVVRITNEEGNHGGTGSHIKAPSGEVYILTNAHVCEIGKKTGSVFVAQDYYETKIERRIIAISQDTDLCLIEALPDNRSLTISSNPPYAQEQVYVLGHPKLYPLTISKGRIIAEVPEVRVLTALILTEEDEAACKAPKNRIEDIETIFGKMHVCLIAIPGYLTTVTILPGNSGSPVVDKMGRLVAVAFAGDNSSNWGIFVTHSDIIQFLKYY